MNRFGLATSSSSPCEGIDSAIAWSTAVVALSLVYTLVVIGSYVLWLQKRFASSPQRLATYWLVASIPKLVAAIVLFTVFLPVGTVDCPFDSSPYYIYPSVSVAICFRWIVRGGVAVLVTEARLDAAPMAVTPPNDNNDDGECHLSLGAVVARSPSNGDKYKTDNNRAGGTGELV